MTVKKTDHEHDRSKQRRDPDPSGSVEKPPDEWISGDEPMTRAQASYLKTLSQQAREPEAYADSLTKAEASKRIEALKAKLDKERSSGRDRPGLSRAPRTRDPLGR